MNKYYSREMIDSEIRKDIPKEIREVILDFLEYLCIEEMDIEKYFERINNTIYGVLDDDDFRYTVIENGIEKEIVMDKKKYSGFYKPVIAYDFESKNYYILKEMLVVRKDKLEDIRGKVIHELLHLLSSKRNLENEIHYCGVSRYSYHVYGDKINCYYNKGESDLNEAITEFLRYELMKEIYSVPYKIEPKRLKNGEVTYVLNAYYMITNLMRVINLGIYKTTRIKKILKLYLDNETELFYEKINRNFEVDETYINETFKIYSETMINMYSKCKTQDDAEKEMLEKIYPSYHNLLCNMYKIFQKKAVEKSRVEVASEYLDDIQKYFEAILSFPFFNIIKRNIMSDINNFRYI